MTVNDEVGEIERLVADSIAQHDKDLGVEALNRADALALTQVRGTNGAHSVSLLRWSVELRERLGVPVAQAFAKAVVELEASGASELQKKTQRRALAAIAKRSVAREPELAVWLGTADIEFTAAELATLAGSDPSTKRS